MYKFSLIVILVLIDMFLMFLNEKVMLQNH